METDEVSFAPPSAFIGGGGNGKLETDEVSSHHLVRLQKSDTPFLAPNHLVDVLKIEKQNLGSFDSRIQLRHGSSTGRAIMVVVNDLRHAVS